MAKFEYKVVVESTIEEYKKNANADIDAADLAKITLVIEAENDFEADKIRGYVTDIRMWEKL